MTNAIFLLCYGDDYYLSGLIETLYAHQQLKPKDVKLVVMCDKVIMQYKKLIAPFCDRIIEIKKMFCFKGYHKTLENQKYAKPWVDYIVNRYQCLQYTEYKKILMFDIDMIPVKRSLYDVFDKYNDISFGFVARGELDTRQFTKIYDITPLKCKSYNEFVKQSREHIDTDYMLLTPNRKLHKEYFTFLNSLKKGKIASTFMGNIDESSFLYFISNLTNESFRCLKAEDYDMAPYHNPFIQLANTKEYININNAKIIRYLAKVKPFNKIAIMNDRPEDRIWNAIELKLINKHVLFKLISIRNALYCCLMSGVYPFNIMDSADNIGVLIIRRKLTDININLNHGIFKPNAYKAIMKNKKILLGLYKDVKSFNDGINYKYFGAIPFSLVNLIL